MAETLVEEQEIQLANRIVMTVVFEQAYQAMTCAIKDVITCPKSDLFLSKSRGLCEQTRQTYLLCSRLLRSLAESDMKTFSALMRDGSNALRTGIEKVGLQGYDYALVSGFAEHCENRAYDLERQYEEMEIGTHAEEHSNVEIEFTAS